MKRLHIVLVLLLAVAIGFSIHAVQHSEKRSQETTQAGQLASKSDRGASSSHRSAEIQSLTSEVLLDGGPDEWFRWLAYLENARLADLPRFVTLVGNNPVALSLIAERWVTLDPENCFRYLLSRREEGDFRYRDSADVLFSKLFVQKWMRRDLEAVVAALDGSESLTGLRDLRELVFRELLESDFPRALELGSRWNSFQDYREMPSSLSNWAQKDPRAAVEAVFAIPGSHLFEPLADAWSHRDPEAALDFGFEKGGDRGFRFAKRVFERWAKDDFGAASQKLSELSEKEATFLTPTLVRAWSEKDPVAALDWSEKSLSGKLKNDAIEQVVIASAFSDAASPKDLLARIESPDAYYQAVVGLSHNLWGKSYSSDDKKLAKAITWFDDVDDPRTLDKIFPEFASFLADYDLEQFKEFIRSPRAQSVSEDSFAYGLGSYAWYDEAEEAMALAAKAPKSYLVEAAPRVFSTWYEKEPKAAIAWVEELARDDPRRPYLVENMSRLLFDKHEQAVTQINAMPPVMSELFRELIAEKQKEQAVYRLRSGGTADWEKLLRDTDPQE